MVVILTPIVLMVVGISGNWLARFPLHQPVVQSTTRSLKDPKLSTLLGVEESRQVTTWRFCFLRVKNGGIFIWVNGQSHLRASSKLGILLLQFDANGKSEAQLYQLFSQISGQITIIPKPELRSFWWDSPTKPPFRVTSADVVLICPEIWWLAPWG